MKKKGFKCGLWQRISAILIVLVMLTGIAAPVLATEQTSERFKILSESETVLPDGYVAKGEVILGLSPAGEQMLPIALASTDIILSALMDVSDAVDQMDSSERKAAFGTTVTQAGCALVLARSASMDTPTLIERIDGCDGVLFAEENTTFNIETDDVSEPTPQPNTTPLTTALPKAEAYKKFEWFLDNTGEVFEGRSGFDLNVKNIARPRGNNETVIAVLDTGIDYTHPDLAGKMIDLTNKKYGNICSDTGCGPFGYNATNAKDHSDPMDDHLHGTHCAGIIAGAGIGISGMMDQATLCAVKVMGSNGSGKNSDIVTGIDWIRQAKEKYGVNIAAVNMSLGDGTTCNLGIKLAVKALDEAGITLCLAAGNEGNNLDIQESSVLDIADSTLVVDAMNANGRKASYSNYGKSTDVFAPGSAILSTIPTNKAKKWFSYVAEEAGQTLAYTGFEDGESGNEKLTFTSSPEGKATESTDHYMTGTKSLGIDVSDGRGAVEMISDAINLSGKVSNNQSNTDTADDKNLYFGMATQDFDEHYVTVSLPVKTGNETASHFEPIAIYADPLGYDFWRKTSAYDYDAFAEAAQKKDGQTIAEILSGFNESNMKSVTQWAADKGVTVDWANFRIKLHIGSLQSTVINGEIEDLPACVEPLYLDCIGLGWGAGHYDLQSGTSMATPGVTGVYGLVYSKYGKTECNDKLSARIMGSVNTTDVDFSQYCITGGMVDAAAALDSDETTFNPVLQTGSVEGDTLILKGWFLGEKQGSLTINGQAAEIITYIPDKNEAKDDADNIGTITAKIPDGIKGEQVVEYTSADNKTGRIYTDVSKITTDFDEETLPVDAFVGLSMARIVEGSNGLAFYCLYEDMSQKLFEYDPEQKQWHLRFIIDQLPGAFPMPIESLIVSLDGDYYAMPKMLFTEDGLKEQFFRLIPDTDEKGYWKAIGKPQDIIMRLPVVVDHTLYLLGGCKNDMTAGIYYNSLSRVTFNGENVTITEIFSDPKLFCTAECKAAVVDGKIYVMNFDHDGDKIAGGLICIDPEGKTVKNYGYPEDPDLVPNGFGLAAFGNSLMLTGKFEGVPTNVWFFDCDTGTWQASDMILDSALSQVVSSVTCGGKVYVLGKTRNNTLWFLRSLGAPTTASSLTWQQGSDQDLTFKINIPLKNFKHKVTINDALLDQNHYSVTEGSNVIALKNTYLKTLATGKYTLRAYFDINGKEVVVPCAFNIIAANNPNNVDTGIQTDNSALLSMIALLIAGSGILLFAIKKRKEI